MAYFIWTAADGTTINLVDNAGYPKYVLSNVWDLQGAPAINQTVKAPYQDGETDIDTLLSARLPVLQYRVVCQTENQLLAARAYLMKAFNAKLGVGLLSWVQSGITYMLYAKPESGGVKFLQGDQSRGVWYQDIQISLRASDPTYYTGVQSSVAMSNVGAFFPFSFPWVVGGTGLTVTIISNGTAPTPVYARISSAIQNPVITITSIINGVSVTQSLSLAITMVDGDLFEINTAFGNKTMYYTPNGGSIGNGMSYIVAGSVFWQIYPGENVITMNGSGMTANTSLVVSWADRYVGA